MRCWQASLITLIPSPLNEEPLSPARRVRRALNTRPPPQARGGSGAGVTQFWEGAGGTRGSASPSPQPLVLPEPGAEGLSGAPGRERLLRPGLRGAGVPRSGPGAVPASRRGRSRCPRPSGAAMGGRAGLGAPRRGSGRSLGLRLRRAAAAAPCGAGRRGRAGECGAEPGECGAAGPSQVRGLRAERKSLERLLRLRRGTGVAQGGLRACRCGACKGQSAVTERG